jgi:hypothetical protein
MRLSYYLLRPGWHVVGSRILPLVLVALLATACQAGASSVTPAAPTPAAAPNLILSADVVQGTKNLTKDQLPTNGCVLSSRFPRNSEIVWRARVYDPRTGQLMNKSQLSSVEVQLANGKTIPMEYGPHPKNPPGEAYWTGSWVVPKDAPTGTLSYKIVAKSIDGRTGEFRPFSVASALPTITDQVLPDVASGTSG